MIRKLIDDYWFDENTLLGWDTERYDYPSLKWYCDKKELGGTLTYDAFITQILASALPQDKTIYDSLSVQTKTNISNVVERMFKKNITRSLPYYNRFDFECELSVFVANNMRAIEKWSNDWSKNIIELTTTELKETSSANTASTNGNSKIINKASDTPQSKVTTIDDGYLSSINDNTTTNEATNNSTQTIKNIDPQKIKGYYDALNEMIDAFSDKGKYLFSSFE